MENTQNVHLIFYSLIRGASLMVNIPLQSNMSRVVGAVPSLLEETVWPGEVYHKYLWPVRPRNS